MLSPRRVYGFNSKLVRLKADATIITMGFSIMFQFQTGAIKSGIQQRDFTGAIPSFNSKLVRLKAGVAMLCC